jgi:acetyl esterase
MPLDPQAESLRDLFVTMALPPLYEQPLADARAAAEGLTLLQGDPEPVAGVMDIQVPGPAGDLPGRVYQARPPDQGATGTVPLIVYFHGGGWTIGSIDLLDRPCRAIANATGSPVASIAYRLAPEHKVPAAVDDAYAATCWLAVHAEDFGAGPVVVAGDSAGGNLAAVVALLARDRGRPTLAGQVLYCPVTAAPSEGSSGSYAAAGEGYMLTAADMRWFWSNYTRSPADETDPLAAPLHAVDLAGLPPTLVIVAGYDPLHDEGLAYAGRLSDAGVEVRVRDYEGQMHDPLWAFGSLDAARDSIGVIADFIASLREQTSVHRSSHG